MQHGATLKLSAAWVPQTMNVDLRWDDAALSNAAPKGQWWAVGGLFGGLAAPEGEWEWDAPNRMLGLRGVAPPATGLGGRPLLAILEPFTFPISPGMRGNGRVTLLIIPTTDTLTFTWEAFVTS